MPPHDTKAADSLREHIRKLIYRRYRSNDVSSIFVHFNRRRDGFLDFNELRNGLARVFGLHTDGRTLWNAFNLDTSKRPGKMSLKEFAQRLSESGSASLPGMSSGARQKAATPMQDESTRYRNLRSAAERDPKRNGDVPAGSNRDSVIAHVVEKLNRTEMSMRELFREMDVSHNKKLDANELLQAVRACGASSDAFSIEQARTVLACFDRDKDGNLSFSDFVRLLAFTEHQEEQRNHDDVRVEVSKTMGTVRAAAARASKHRAARLVSKNLGLSKNISSREYGAIKLISDAVYGSRRKVRHLFRLMDTDGSRTLNSEELRVGLSECGLQMDIEDVSALVDHFSQQSGELSYSKFIKLLAAKP